MQTTEDEWGAGLSPLFSTVAPENAEVLPETEYRSVDQLWSVEAADDDEVEIPSSADLGSVPAPDAQAFVWDDTPTPPIETEMPVEDETFSTYSGDDDDDTIIVEAEIVEESEPDDNGRVQDNAFVTNGDVFAAPTAHDGQYGTFDEPASPFAQMSSEAGERNTWVHDEGATDWSDPESHLYDSDGTFVGGGVFSAEPTIDTPDVIDEFDDELDEVPTDQVEESWIPPHLSDTTNPLFGSSSVSMSDQDQLDGDLFDTAARGIGVTTNIQAPSSDPWVSLEDTGTEPGEVEDVAGTFDDAIERLSIDEQNRVAIPLAVCGSLLGADERVYGVVGGQMLGQPAVIVLTDFRVLIVNARRWRPIVDEYAVDGSLIVRGRHDRDVAALSFADPEKFSMVDDITDVELAIELADQIRSA